MTTDTAPTPDMPGAAKDAQAPSRRHMDLSGVAFSRPRGDPTFGLWATLALEFLARSTSRQYIQSWSLIQQRRASVPWSSIE
jgi:hypothetical protein